MLFEGLYHPPYMTPDGMRGRGGEGREALDTSRKSSIYSDDQFRLGFWNVIRWKPQKNLAELPSHGQKIAGSNDMIEIFGCSLGILEKWCLTQRQA